MTTCRFRGAGEKEGGARGASGAEAEAEGDDGEGARAVEAGRGRRGRRPRSAVRESAEAEAAVVEGAAWRPGAAATPLSLNPGWTAVASPAMASCA